MNREIKFRAWDKVNKKMYPVEKLFFENNKLDYVGIDCEELEDIFQVIDINLVETMQYTGLKDKNGKEIYEGDIVTSHNGVVQGVVVYQAPSFVIKKNIKNKTWTEFILSAKENQYQTVIGNIYENPELLEVENA